MERLFHVCKSGKGNASLLYEALVYAKPDDLKEKGVIQEFLARSRSSQDLIFSQIPWATSQAERSRRKAHSKKETKEERLLAELLGTNEQLLEVIKMYTDMERVGIEEGALARALEDQKLRALEVITSFQPTTGETAIVNQIFDMADTRGVGNISSHAAVKIFSGSRLSPSTLADIWRIANVEESEMLSKQVVGVAVRLIGHAQANTGKKVDEGWVLLQGPLANIEGLEPTGHLHHEPVAGPSSSGSSFFTNYPALTAEDRNKFMKIFIGSKPEHGTLNGARAREVLMKSKLPRHVLAQIWELADVHRRGYLDASSFIVAMYLVQAIMSGHMKSIPQSLPPSLYFDASPMSPVDVMSPMSPTSSSFLQSPGARPSSSSQGLVWDVTREEKSTSDAFFSVLDEQNRGYLEGKVARAHFLQSGLPEQDVKRIWNLVDFNGDGRLGQDGFAVALHLIQARHNAVPLPKTLPHTLIPPALRESATSQEESLIDLADSTPLPSIPPLLPTFTGLSISPTSPTFDPSSKATNLLAGLPSTSQKFLTTTGRFASSLPDHAVSAPATRPPTTNPLSVARSGSISQPHLLPPSSGKVAPPITPSAPVESVSPDGWTWDVTPTEKASSDGFFDILDPWKHGYIEGDAAVPFMSKSKLPEPVLAKIWDLADADSDGRLSKEDFAVAMHLIKAKLAGKEVPDILPPSLIPPPSVLVQHNEEEASPFDDPVPISMPVPVPTPAPALASTRTPAPAPITAPPPAAHQGGAHDADREPPLPPPPEVDLPPDEPPRSQTPPPPYALVDAIATAAPASGS